MPPRFEDGFSPALSRATLPCRSAEFGKQGAITGLLWTYLLDGRVTIAFGTLGAKEPAAR